MTAYYNEIDPYAAQWLRNLIKAGHIAPGYVDERSIIDVKPEDLTDFTQCHFFAGIGAWSLALRNAGWPDDRPVWTGSCPCQPFSVAGNQRGQLDERHLAPVWLNLIQQQKPPVIFGEQVAGAISKNWLDDLFNELETEGYACGAAVLPACSVGAPHIRQRLTFGAKRVANPHGEQQRSGSLRREGAEYVPARRFESSAAPSGLCIAGGMANCNDNRQQPGEGGGSGRKSSCSRNDSGWSCSPGGLVNAAHQRLQGFGSDNNALGREGPDVRQAGLFDRTGSSSIATPVNGVWRDADWLLCRDGKWRPVESGTFPLANGIANRVGRLRAYGNAIVPQAATKFIIAFEGATS
ncbi:UNVERIFIED_ORG: DNA (cytosine-5)-methyltransferase 1 [Rahnella aquatilis]